MKLRTQKASVCYTNLRVESPQLISHRPF